EQRERALRPQFNRGLAVGGIGIPEAERVHCDRAEIATDQRQHIAVLVPRARCCVEEKNGKAGSCHGDVDAAEGRRNETTLDAGTGSASAHFVTPMPARGSCLRRVSTTTAASIVLVRPRSMLTSRSGRGCYQPRGMQCAKCWFCLPSWAACGGLRHQLR